MILTLYRAPSGQFGTFGILFHGQVPLCNTLEEPWKDNHRNISCIPEGTYKCVPHNSQRFSNVWRLKDVPGRSGILIHAGNVIDDIEGCILVGEGIGAIGGFPALLDSRAALEVLRDYLPRKFTLEIINPESKAPIPPKLPWWRRIFKGD